MNYPLLLFKRVDDMVKSETEREFNWYRDMVMDLMKGITWEGHKDAVVESEEEMKRKKDKNEKLFEIGYKLNEAICSLSKLRREGKENLTDEDIKSLEEMSELLDKAIEGKKVLDEMWGENNEWRENKGKNR